MSFEVVRGRAVATALIVALIAAGVVGCAPPAPTLAALKHLPGHLWTVPGGVHGEAYVDGVDATPIYTQWWRPQGAVRAVVVVLHGLKDHSDRYGTLAAALVARGVAVYALDHRGHGRSGGPRQAVDDFDDYVADAAALIATARRREPGVPVFVFGHSMGGLIATRLAERDPGLAGVILSGPALGLDIPAIKAGAVRFLGVWARWFPALDLPAGDFSSVPAVVADLKSDPLIARGKGPVRTASELINAAGDAWDDAGRLTAPLLIVHGTADRLTAPAASRAFIDTVGSTDRTYRLLDGWWHDLLHEPGGAQLADDLAAWIDARVAGPVPTLEVPAPRPLVGDRPGLYLSAGLAARVARGDRLAALRVALAAPRPIGWMGVAELRSGEAGTLADLQVAGLGIRLGRAGLVGVTTGLRFGLGDGWPIAAPASLVLEIPLGPVQGVVRGGAAWSVRGGAAEPDLPAGVDDARAMIGLRVLSDRGLWRDTSAGGGLLVGATYRRLAGSDLFGVEFALELDGAD